MIQLLKTGIVLEENKKTVYIVTSEYEFYELYKNNKTCPKLGEEYTGETIKKTRIYNSIIIPIVSIILSVLLIFFFINKHTIRYTAVININSSIELKLNKSNDVVKVNPLSNKSFEITENLNLKGKSFDKATSSIIKQGKKQKYINDNDTVNIYITSHKNLKINFSSFENVAKSNKVNIIINDYGVEHIIKGK